MMYLGRLPADLLGKSGALKQLKAYSILRKEPPPYLKRFLRCVDDAINAIEDDRARRVIIGVYRDGYSLRELQWLWHKPRPWLEAWHALGVSEFELHVAAAFGNYLPTLPGEPEFGAETDTASSDGMKEW